jgi:GT2 family glycosyltransferase
MQDSDKIKICAVVVTYNRLELLKRCIQSLRMQTRKLDQILVINNDSSDGTKEWLELQEDLRVITQQNLGGAGGFYTGIRTAYEDRFDWIWCMDDDVYIDNKALWNIINIPDKYTVRNSMVVSSEVKNLLCFGLLDDFGRRYESTNDIDDIMIVGAGNLFNGTLIHKRVVEKIGLPIKELFIRGDEFEYLLRIKANNFEIVTVTNSIMYHPKERSKQFRTFLFNHKYLYLEKTKRYYRTRNLCIIKKLHRSFKIRDLIKQLILDTVLILFYQHDFRILYYHLKGLVDGIKWNYTYGNKKLNDL